MENGPTLTFQVRSSGLLKYLGSKKAISEDSSQEISSLQEFIKEITRNIKEKTIQPETQSRYTKAVIHAKVTYQSSHMGGSNKRITTMDTIMGKLYKHACHLPHSFPNALLYGNTEEGGLGFQRLSDLTQLRKIDLLEWALESSDKQTRWAALCCIRRMQAAGTVNFNRPNHKKLWTYSLWQWLQEIGCEFTTGQGEMMGKMQLPGNKWLITKVQDLVEWTGDCHTFIDPQIFSLSEAKWARRKVEGLVQLTTGLKLINTDSEGKATELIILEGKVDPTTWRCSIWCPRGGKWMARSTSRQRLKHTTTTTRTSMVLSQLTHSGLGFKEGDDIVLIKLLRIKIEQAEGPSPSTQEVVYTDGSFTTTFTGLLQPAKMVYSGSIIRLNQGQFKDGLHIKDDVGLHYRSFGAESIALCYSAIRHPGPIVSDCKAAVSLLMDSNSKPPASLKKLYTIARSKLRGKAQWVRAHTLEKNGGQLQELSIHEKGNMYADLVAKGDLKTNVKEVLVSQILKEAGKCNKWGVRKQNQLVIGKLLEMKAHSDLCEYWKTESRTMHQWSTYIALMQHKQMTLREKATRIKLFLSRFDRDRKGLENQLPSCPCGCANYITTWVSTCSQPRVVEMRAAGLIQATAAIVSTPLKAAFILRLSSNEPRLWRGDWRQVDIDFITERMQLTQPNWKCLTEQLCKAIFELGTAALTMQSEMTGNNKKLNCKKCPLYKQKCKGKRERKLAQLREQSTNHKITEYFVPMKKQRTGIG